MYEESTGDKRRAEASPRLASRVSLLVVPFKFSSGMPCSRSSSLLSSTFSQRIVSDVGRLRRAKCNDGTRGENGDRRYKSAGDERRRKRDEGRQRRRIVRPVPFSSKISCELTRSEVMPAARREHTRPPQYENIIGRKPEGTQQCAELSPAASALQRDLSLSRCSATSGRQDFRWVLVRWIRMAQKRSRARRKGGAPEPICERNGGGDRLQQY